MYEILKTVIARGGFKLSDMQSKIKKMFVLGDLTEEQTDELLTLASGGISADAERPETLQMLRALSAEIEALQARVKALEGDGGEDAAYPAWKPWNGLSKDYQYGAIVSHVGEVWESHYNGQNVWEPGTPGTEAIWVRRS